MNDVRETLVQLNRLLVEVSDHLSEPTKAHRRAAAVKLERIVAIASTLAATIHTPNQ